MNLKTLAILLLIFGLCCTLAQCRRLNVRQDDSDDDDNNNNGNTGDDSNGDDDGANGDDDDSDDADLKTEKRAILNYLENEKASNQFLDRSSRLFVGDQKSHMKEAKKQYEEKCERLLHPRYCPDLATWPAWNTAFNSASGKK